MNTVGLEDRADLRRIYCEIESTPLPLRSPVVRQPEPSEVARQALIDLVERGSVRIVFDRLP